jgi:hypothetical protein
MRVHHLEKIARWEKQCAPSALVKGAIIVEARARKKLRPLMRKVGEREKEFHVVLIIVFLLRKRGTLALTKFGALFGVLQIAAPKRNFSPKAVALLRVLHFSGQLSERWRPPATKISPLINTKWLRRAHREHRAALSPKEREIFAAQVLLRARFKRAT